jgi:tetratricopeptide (TPR) repeat protein
MNHESIEDLYARWQQNPDTARTIALCEALRSGQRPDLVEIVGSHAARQPDASALLAGARMYVDSGRLDDAQTLLLAAGRIAPREGEVYRWLGDVLLRRGDAERAEKVLEKAMQFGSDADTGPLLDRARAYVPMQRASGVASVAEAVRAELGVRPRFISVSDDDLETTVRKQDDVGAIVDVTLGPPLPAAGRPPLTPPPILLPPRSGPSVRPEQIIFTTPSRGVVFDPQPSQTGPNDIARVAPNVFADTSPFRSEARPAVTGDFHHRPPSSSQRLPPSSGRLPENRLVPLGPASFGSPPAIALPGARDVLDALEVAGIFEPHGAVSPQAFSWTKPQAQRRWFSTVTLLALAGGLVVGGGGVHRYVTAQRAKAHLEAEQLLTQVDHQLQGSDPRQLDAAEKAIARAFELESRSPHAALTWLHERALVGLLRSGADLAFEDATQRAKAVGIPEKQLACAYVASFLYQGDTAGSVATIAKWDPVAQDDAWFQVVAGATFERAGDARSLERYAAAVRLDPGLVIAQVLLTRSTTMDGDPRRAAELARDFRARHPDRAEGPALVALAWTRDPLRGEPPAEIRDVTERGDALPPALRAVPHAARGILSLHKGAIDEAKPSLQKGLEVADSPGIAAWLGSIALATGDEALARKAALSAVSFSAVYPPARVLAARVALLGARLDEALKATEDLPAAWADVAVVVAAASYEKLDAERVGRAFEGIPDDAKKLPFVLPLARGQALLAGSLGVMNAQTALAMAEDEAPWADIVAMDWALDAGDLETAKKIAEPWKAQPRALRAVRLARLARFEGKLDEAEKMSRLALDGGSVTMRALVERVFTLVAMKKDADALAVFKTYPNVGGPLAKWLRAYATAAHGRHEEARAIISQEDPPPSAAPMPARMLAAAAYGAIKDVRHGGEYTKPILAAGFVNPDMAAAAERLGLGKPARRQR